MGQMIYIVNLFLIFILLDCHSNSENNKNQSFFNPDTIELKRFDENLFNDDEIYYNSDTVCSENVLVKTKKEEIVKQLNPYLASPQFFVRDSGSVWYVFRIILDKNKKIRQIIPLRYNNLTIAKKMCSVFYKLDCEFFDTNAHCQAYSFPIVINAINKTIKIPQNREDYFIQLRK